MTEQWWKELMTEFESMTDEEFKKLLIIVSCEETKRKVESMPSDEFIKIWNGEQTNEEWIKSLNTEELAEFLNLIIRVGPYENEPKDFWKHVYGRGGDRGERSIIEWLKEVHKNA